MASESKSRATLLRSVRADEAEINALLDAMDATPADGGESKRTSERFSFRRNACVVHVQQPGAAESAAYQAATRNLSAGGVAFLHGGFVHKNSKCVVQLISTHGAWENVPGTVAGCEHVQGLIHEVRIRFEREIDVGQYCPDAVKTRVLLAEDDPSIARMVLAQLGRLNAEVTHVEDGQQSIEEAQRTMYDVILMDMEMPVLDGFGATRALREQGYSGKIVAATALTEPVDRERCLQAGCDDHISKPYFKEDLADLLKSLQQEPLFSSLADDVSMTGLIDAFCIELPAKLRSVEEAFAAEELDRLESLTRKLKGEAGAYGFEPITDAARKIESGLRSKAPIATIKSNLGELVRLCLMARSSARSESK